MLGKKGILFSSAHLGPEVKPGFFDIITWWTEVKHFGCKIHMFEFFNNNGEWVSQGLSEWVTLPSLLRIFLKAIKLIVSPQAESNSFSSTWNENNDCAPHRVSGIIVPWKDFLAFRYILNVFNFSAVPFSHFFSVLLFAILALFLEIGSLWTELSQISKEIIVTDKLRG